MVGTNNLTDEVILKSGISYVTAMEPRLYSSGIIYKVEDMWSDWSHEKISYPILGNMQRSDIEGPDRMHFVTTHTTRSC